MLSVSPQSGVRWHSIGDTSADGTLSHRGPGRECHDVGDHRTDAGLRYFHYCRDFPPRVCSQAADRGNDHGARAFTYWSGSGSPVFTHCWLRCNRTPFIWTRPSPSTHAEQVYLIYYSFGTMTCLGATGIAAVSNQARSLSLIEAILGVLYLAVLISRLDRFSWRPPH